MAGAWDRSEWRWIIGIECIIIELVKMKIMESMSDWKISYQQQWQQQQPWQQQQE